MPGEDTQHPRPPACVVTDLIAAICDGRTEDALALIHPQAEWQPSTRPALSLYQGHAGIALLIADIRAAYGPYRVEIDTITAETATHTSTQVTARTHVVRETGHGDQRMPAITTVFTLHDGLVTSVESNPDTPQPHTS